mmetsp:Transcript_2636/g.5695  ORF Transcript_2636/g.5695 Transcript_2636/m.5695 type:complete len:461 (+) Transcript_2636:55-1437(+)
MLWKVMHHHGVMGNTAGASAAAAAAAAAAHSTKHFLPPIPPDNSKIISKVRLLRRQRTKAHEGNGNSEIGVGGILHHQQQEEEDRYICIKQILGGALGGQIWGSASSLCQFIANNPQRFGEMFVKDNENEGVENSDINDADRILKLKTSLGGPILKDRSLRLQLPHSRLPILELGSGTGAVGIWTSIALCRHVILTEHRPPIQSVMTSVPYSVDGMYEDDLTQNDELSKPKTRKTSDRLLRLLQENIELNRRHLLFGNNDDSTGNMDDGTEKDDDVKEDDSMKKMVPMMFVREFDWKHHEEQCQQLLDEFIHSPSSPATTRASGFDCILGSDLTYDSSVHKDLARTISKLLAKNGRNHNDDSSVPTCWIAHQPRVYGLFNGNDDGDRLGGGRNQDLQLQSFRKALEDVGLSIVRTHCSSSVTCKHANSLSTTSAASSTTSSRHVQSDQKDKVLILEIRHQ